MRTEEYIKLEDDIFFLVIEKIIIEQAERKGADRLGRQVAQRRRWSSIEAAPQDVRSSSASADVLQFLRQSRQSKRRQLLEGMKHETGGCPGCYVEAW